MQRIVTTAILLTAFIARPSYTFSPAARHLPAVAVQRTPSSVKSPTSLNVVQDLDVIGLVAGQENYGLAVVCVGEAVWSFLGAPSLSHAKVLIPAAIASVVLVAVSGPMITSGDASAVATGLWIATAVSAGLGASYIARLLAPFSPTPKEIAALGLLVAIAGFFSFAQNLIVDGFVSLPSLPSLPTFELPEISLESPSTEQPSIVLPAMEQPEVSIAPSALPAPSVPSPIEIF